MNTLEELVAFLVQTRKSKGLHQSDVARTMKVGQPSVSEFERGKVASKVSTVLRYAEAVGVEVTFNVNVLETTDNGQ